MRLRVEVEQYENNAPQSPETAAQESRERVREVRATSAQLATDPGFGGMVEVVA